MLFRPTTSRPSPSNRTVVIALCVGMSSCGPAPGPDASIDAGSDSSDVSVARDVPIDDAPARDAGIVAPPDPVPLPGSTGSIGFDDLRYSSVLHRVIVAAGETGRVDLIDPDTLAVTEIGGLMQPETADEGAGLVFVGDRGANLLVVLDPVTRSAVASVTPGGAIDYVRYVAPTREVWITERDRLGIEVFSIPQTGTPSPTSVAFIPTPQAPEGITVDATRRRVYVHRFADGVSSIDIDARRVMDGWPTGCSGSHGIPALDETAGFLMAGCDTAEGVLLDLNRGGMQTGQFAFDSGSTLMAFSSTLRHFYLRGDPGMPVVFLGRSHAGMLQMLGTADASPSGHCVTADDRGNVWVCDSTNGRLLRFRDPFPASEP